MAFEIVPLLVLENGLKISYHTEGDFFQLNLPRIDEKRGY